MKETKFKEGDIVVLVDEETLRKWRKDNNYRDIKKEFISEMKNGVSVWQIIVSDMWVKSSNSSVFRTFAVPHYAFALKGAK